MRDDIQNYESNQKDATMQVNILFLVSSTCFGRCFCPSSGALYCIYSIWHCLPKLPPAGALVELKTATFQFQLIQDTGRQQLG
jgi:hypothetical protein